jgi:hypothetical protein
MTQIRHNRVPVCEDRPAMHLTSDDGLRLELGDLGSSWVIELTHAECERIAEAIGYRRPGYFRVPDSDS